MIELSRVGRITNPPEDIPFGESVKEAMELVVGPTEEARVKVDIQPNLLVHGNRPRLVELMQNPLFLYVAAGSIKIKHHISITLQLAPANTKCG